MSNSKPSQNPLERIFEAILWKSRLIVLLAVISGICGAFGLFVLGTVEIFKTVGEISFAPGQGHDYSGVLIGIIGAVDLFLIGIVLLIFSFGVYELFVSAIDEARADKGLKILDINSLDELKTKVLQVIVVVTIVTFFKAIVVMHFTTSLDILYFALSIAAICAGVFLLKKSKDDE